MASAQVLYAESTAHVTANSTTWVDVATIPAASFTPNKKYLILAWGYLKGGSASALPRIRLVHGTTPTQFTDAFTVMEPGGASAQVPFGWVYTFDQPGTTELVKIQISDSAALTATCELAQILAIKLSDDFVENTDWYYAEDTADSAYANGTPKDGASITVAANGSDRWLCIANGATDIGNVTQIYQNHLSIAGANERSLTGWEGEDAAAFHNHVLLRSKVLANGNNVVKFVYTGSGVAHAHLSSRVFAINLAKFAQLVQNEQGVNQVPPQPAFSAGNPCSVSVTPDATGNFVALAQAILETPTASNQQDHRLQHNNSGSFVSDPSFGDDVPNVNYGNAVNENSPVHLMKLVSLTSGASRTVRYEWKRRANNTTLIDVPELIVFSVELAAAGTGYTRDLNDVVPLADTPSKAMGFGRAPGDVLSLSDSAARAGDFGRAASDVLVLADDSSRSIGFERAADDVLVLSDDAARVADFGRGFDDVLVLSDDAARAVDFERAPSDALVLSDTMTFSKLLERVISDVLAIGDYSTYRLGPIFSLWTAIVSETTGTAFGRSLGDDAGSADVLARESVFERLFDDINALADIVAIARTLDRLIQDDQTLTDLAETVLLGGGMAYERLLNDPGTTTPAGPNDYIYQLPRRLAGTSDLFSKSWNFVRERNDVVGLSDRASWEGSVPEFGPLAGEQWVYDNAGPRPVTDPGGGITVTSRATLQAAIDANPSGSKFIFEAGLGSRDWDAGINAGNKAPHVYFLGDAAAGTCATLDGGGRNIIGFNSTNNGPVPLNIHGGRFTNFGNASGQPFHMPFLIRTGGIAEDFFCFSNGQNGFGLQGGSARYGKVLSNGHYGFAASGDGVNPDVVINADHFAEHLWIEDNNTLELNPGDDSSATKFTGQWGFLVRYNVCKANRGFGLWPDLASGQGLGGVRLEENISEDNWRTGLFIEGVAGGCTAIRNIVRNNGRAVTIGGQGPTNVNNAQLRITNSNCSLGSGIRGIVSRNVLDFTLTPTSTNPGWMLLMWNHTGHPDAMNEWDVDRNQFWNRYTLQTGAAVRMLDSATTVFPMMGDADITFTDNEYHVASTSFEYWQEVEIGTRTEDLVNYTEWQARYPGDDIALVVI